MGRRAVRGQGSPVHARQPTVLRANSLAVLVLVATVLGLTDRSRIVGPGPGEIGFLGPFTNDLPGMLDPGYNRDVASCTAQVLHNTLLAVHVRNAYPRYACTVQATIYNGSTVPVQLESLEIRAPRALTVAGLDDLVGLILAPGRGVVHSFTLRVGQAAEPSASYSFHISELFRAAEDEVGERPGRLVSPRKQWSSRAGMWITVR